MKLTSSILHTSDSFRANQAGARSRLEEIRAAQAMARAGGGAKALQRHTERGKMPPRDRVANLLDHGSPFLEIGATAAHDLYDNAAPGAGVIAGIGRVHGQE
jgi:3-methylcrotonyl-CoA carboxylase beta subunit